MSKAYLILEDGHIFEGSSIGAQGDVTGELVFTTGMGGYIETLTDPSYFGQIIMQTFPLIGNYGYIPEDAEADKSFASGYVVRELCEGYSNFRAEKGLDLFLKEQGIVGISGVDTREITLILREHGVMNAKITGSVTDGILDEIKRYAVSAAVEKTSNQDEVFYKAQGESKYRVALIDYGAKMNIVRSLNRFGCDVTVVPYNTPAERIIDSGFDGIMLSNGPGDPAENTFCINEIKKMMGRKPIFGICLGHQLLALAAGAGTAKLKYGHRGANQPVKDLKTGRVYISSQNHGYAVLNQSLEAAGGRVSFLNANDGTCEGAEYPRLEAFSVQFHPEACGGPHDTVFLFRRFIKMMAENTGKNRF